MKSFSLLLALAAFSVPAFAQVTVEKPWARATAPHQTVSGAFMQIMSTKNAKLIGGQSPVGTVEIHEMRLENNVMKMRQIDNLPLPAGKSVELKPGGYHLMFTGLRQALKEGEKVDLTLTIETENKARETIALKVPVLPFTKAH
jgi:copper(I)-binding protein